MLINSFSDLFEHTRAIDFQTTFILSGLHPEFIAFRDIDSKQAKSICGIKHNPIFDTYISEMLILEKQSNPDFYKALGLSTEETFYKDVVGGLSNFRQIINRCFSDLDNQVAKKLESEHYLVYSNKTNQDIIKYLGMHKTEVEKYKKNLLSFDELKEKLLWLNYKIVKTRNLLSFGIKN